LAGNAGDAVMTAGRFTIAGPPPRLDDRRVYQGRAQLSVADHRILGAADRHGLRAGHEAGEPVFRCDGRKLRRQAVLRLLELGYLVNADDRLFEGVGAQTLLVNTTPPAFSERARPMPVSAVIAPARHVIDLDDEIPLES
jgi:hypothetical protein